MQYKPKNFILEELVSPDTFTMRGERAWELLDGAALFTLQSLRDALGPCVVNNWHMGGQYIESGLRDFHSKTGAKYSQHKYGRAFDCKFTHVTPKEAFEYIKANADKFDHLSTIEDVNFTPTWFHFDTRNHMQRGIRIVKP